MNLKQKKYDLMNTRKGLLDEAKLRRVLGHNREMEGCIVEAYPKG